MSIIHRWRWLEAGRGPRFHGALVCVSEGGRELGRLELAGEIGELSDLAKCHPRCSPLRDFFDTLLTLGKGARPQRESLGPPDLAVHAAVLDEADDALWAELIGQASEAGGLVGRWRSSWLLANVDNEHYRGIFRGVLDLARQARATDGALRLEPGSSAPADPDPTVLHVAD